MSIPIIAVICVLFIAIIALIVFVAKNVFAPLKEENILRFVKQGKISNAVKLAKQIISKDPKNYMARYYLGKAYIKDNKSELAILEYKFVNENALFNRGLSEVDFRKEYSQLLLQHNQQAEALKQCLLLTKIAPDDKENYYNVGHLYQLTGHYDTAVTYMKKAILLNPRHPKAHAEMGLMLYRMKSFADAKKEIDLAIKISPDTYSSYYYLGKIQKDSKDIPAAIKSFERAQRDSEIKQKAVIEHGTCYMLVNRFDNAIVDFQRAIELDKENMSSETLYARYFLASCYEKLRKMDKAIEQWTIISKKNKGFRDVGAKLAEYSDLQTNDYLKDYLTCNNEEFLIYCKNACEKAMKLQVLSSESKKWGCIIVGYEKNGDSWMSVRKMNYYIRFYREIEPLEDSAIRETLETMKNHNCLKSYIFSSSGFTMSAKKFADNRPIELSDKERLESFLASAGTK